MKYIQEPSRCSHLDIISAYGIPFRVLTDVRANLVEFWDTRHAGMHPVQNIVMPGHIAGGEFSVGQLLNDVSGGSLTLAADVPAWHIDSASMYVVRVWLRHLRMRDASVSHAAEQEVI